jgi:hypothetical protein
MPERLTVVFDDPNLYRRLKIFSASEGIAMKRLVEEALTEFLDARVRAGKREAGLEPKVLDWERWETAGAEFEALAEPGEGPSNLSDIKRHLYNYPPRALTTEGWRSVAEEAAPYDEEA